MIFLKPSHLQAIFKAKNLHVVSAILSLVAVFLLGAVSVSAAGKPPIPASCPGGGSTVAVAPGPECNPPTNPAGCPGSTQPAPATGFKESSCTYSNKPSSVTAPTIGNSVCKTPTFFGLPVWYKYLELSDTCAPKVKALSDVWLIVAAVIEILLRLAAIIAIVFVLMGGTQFLISQGEPDRIAKARKTVLGALSGLVISVAAATIISFVAGRFH